MFETYLTWIKAHERLLLVAVAGVVLFFSIGKIDSLIANHDLAVLRKSEVTANIQADWNAKQAALVAAQAAQYEALAKQVAAQNAALEQANVALATALAKQQKVDAELPPSELVARWNTLVPTAGATVTPSGVSLSQSGAISTVQELEKVPVLNEQLSNSNAKLQNVDNLLSASQTQVGTLTAQVSGLNKQIVDDAKACKDQVKAAKAVARKSKLKWFGAGFVTGLTLGIVKF